MRIFAMEQKLDNASERLSLLTAREAANYLRVSISAHTRRTPALYSGHAKLILKHGQGFSRNGVDHGTSIYSGDRGR